uniref:Myb-like domain-containing protein n=1 Tax=Kwoniella dejecticola CBS 10117 TaxID=1296121 RepID=A0A1A6A4V4_9TREE|nr:uncharacterized protein I303_04418 [Kwoniella dejecticola CBS 10117]OBR85087.1 hypothetical protein I303_04418 [Kwoniella dejecticola CBS 10117]
MPPKREKIRKSDSHSDSDSEETKPLIRSPKKAKKTPNSPRKASQIQNRQFLEPERKLWTDVEEAQLWQAINDIVKSNIWNEIKNNYPDLAKRGADGVANHWASLNS